MSEVGAWLRSLGLERFTELFEANELDAATLPKLTNDDLKDLEIPLGPRKKLLEAIATLDQAPATDDPHPRATSPRASPSTGQAERRQLTVMFVDLVGSTALSARLDPEEMGAVLRTYQNTVAGEIARLEGHVAKFMGDGVLAYFGWPVAHEDEAERAVRAGLAIVAAVERLGAGDTALACRIGIATGLVVVGELIGEGSASEQTVVGETPNLAARLQGVAEPGQVVITETTRQLVGAAFELAPLAAQTLKGLSLPVTPFAVLGERAAGSRFEARSGAEFLPMVGRDQELALLLERWAQAKRGEGQAVLLVGEAGIGKSRITRALLDAVRAEPHVRVRFQCSPYHTDSAFWPVVQQLTRAAGFADQDTVEQRLDKLEAVLARAGDTSAAPLLADLLGLDGTSRYGAIELSPQAQRTRTLRALIDQILGLARRQPVLLVLEDAHWIDPTTLELVEQALDRGATAPLLLLLTSRPENQPALAGHPHVTRLTLNRLGRAGVEAIVERLSSGTVLPDEVIDTIIARTDGVPLFVEELTKAVLESGDASVPASLHDSLMARLDRIPEVKEVAQIAAVIGREFDHELLAAVAEHPEAALTDSLGKLATAELVFRRGTPPEAHYTFKHALVRDAAYQSLLKTRRRELHGRIAEALRHRFPQRIADQPELVARHLTEADLTEEAIPLWQEAGERAARASANVEAIAHFRQAIALTETLPPSEATRLQELNLQTGIMGPLIAAKGYTVADTRATCARAQALAQDSDPPDLLFPALYGHWAMLFVSGDAAGARPVGERIWRLAQVHDDPGPRLIAHRIRANHLYWMGRTRAAAGEYAHTLSLYDNERHAALTYQTGTNPYIAALSLRSAAQWELGYPDQAAEGANRAIEAALQLGHTNSIGYALTWAGQLCFHLLRDRAAVTRRAREAVALAEEQGMPAWRAMAEMGVGWSEAVSLEKPEGLATVRQGLAAIEAQGTFFFHTFHLLRLAEAQLALGSPDDALATLNDALAVGERHEETLLEPELRRQRGLVRLDFGGDAAAAEADLHQALTLARERETRSWELRIARDLARLWAERGERQRALDLLAPVYDWFTEGFDTPDLMEAKALLDELR